MILADKIVRLEKEKRLVARRACAEDECIETGSLKMGKRADRPGAGKNFAAWSVV